MPAILGENGVVHFYAMPHVLVQIGLIGQRVKPNMANRQILIRKHHRSRRPWCESGIVLNHRQKMLRRAAVLTEHIGMHSESQMLFSVFRATPNNRSQRVYSQRSKNQAFRCDVSHSSEYEDQGTSMRCRRLTDNNRNTMVTAITPMIAVADATGS